MKILIVGLVNNLQIKRLKEEGNKRGHNIDGCYSRDLSLYSKKGLFEPALTDLDIGSYDLIYLWAMSKRRWEWYTASYFLNKTKQTVIVNSKILDPDYLYFLSPAMDYLKQVEDNLPFPASAVILSKKSVSKVINNFSFPVILKLSGGKQGRSVFLIKTQTDLEEKIDENEHLNQSFVIREYIPNDGDIRVFTVGYRTIGVMKRTPPKGDFRSNISQGGMGAEFNLDNNSEIKILAEKISRVTKTEIAGVDIMIHKETQKPYILEINPGPQFMGLEKYTKTNATLEIIKYFEELVNKK